MVEMVISIYSFLFWQSRKERYKLILGVEQSKKDSNLSCPLELLDFILTLKGPRPFFCQKPLKTASFAAFISQKRKIHIFRI